MRAPRRANILVLCAFAASRIEHRFAAQIAGEFQESRIVPMLAKNVPAVANLVGPHVGIAIPLRGNFRLTNFRRHFFFTPPARCATEKNTDEENLVR